MQPTLKLLILRVLTLLGGAYLQTILCAQSHSWTQWRACRVYITVETGL